MPISLKSKLSSLRYKGLITDAEYKELVKKLNGHDREIRNKAIDDYKKLLIENNVIPEWREVIEELAEEVRENGDNRKLLHETGDGQ